MMEIRQILGSWPCLQRSGVLGGVTSRKVMLHRPSTVSHGRSALTCGGSRSSSRMATACLERPDPVDSEFSRRVTAGGDVKNDRTSLGKFVGGIVAALSDKLEEAKSALASNSGCAVVLVRRRVSVTVPRGRRVSERMWKDLEATCRVTFSSEVLTTLVPTKEQCYPSPAYWAACFYTASDIKTARKFTSEQGGGSAEWKKLLAETRLLAEEGRKRHHNDQLLSKGKDDAAGEALNKKQSNRAAQTAGGTNCGVIVDEDGGSAIIGASGHGVPQEKPASFFAESHRRPPCPSQEVGEVRGRRLASLVKALGRWFDRFHRTPRIRQGSGMESSYDWVIDVSEESQNIV